MDIYFKKKYGKLYEQIEDGVTEIFEHKSHLGTIRHMYIKREVPIKIDGTTYYDLVTPYGYGGPLIITTTDQESSKELVKEFYGAFEEYCQRNNIVSEFVRFHPVLKNYEEFDTIYDPQYLRKTVGTDLEKYKDPFQTEFSKSARKNVRRALRDGVTFEIDEEPADISEFTNIYNTTMDRNAADDYYYFGETYFENIINNFQQNIILVKAICENKTVAAGLYFIYGKTIHIHLSGTLDEYLHMSPAYILRYAVTQWGKEHGYKLIHHGGGRTSKKDDGLFRFKKRFGQNTEFDFYIGKKVWNNKVYNQLSDLNESKRNTEYFPAYRSDIV